MVGTPDISYGHPCSLTSGAECRPSSDNCPFGFLFSEMRRIPGKAGPGDLKGYPTLPPTSPSQKSGPCVEASALAPCGSISHPVLGSFYPGNYRGSRAWIWVATARKPQPKDPAQAHTLSDQALPVLQEQADQLLCPLLRASVAGLKSGLASHHIFTGYVLDSHMGGACISDTILQS